MLRGLSDVLFPSGLHSFLTKSAEECVKGLGCDNLLQALFASYSRHLAAEYLAT